MSSLLSTILRFLTPHLPTTSSSSARPLFVAISGTQGSGKTTTTTQLASTLRSPPYSLTVAVLSIDDFYLAHAAQQRLAKSNLDNQLLQHRGVAGTHDLPLAYAVFAALKRGDQVELPVYDKAAFSGAGDRAQPGVLVRGRVDVVVFEGWCVGFRALGTEGVRAAWERSTGVAGRHRIGNLLAVDQALEGYEGLTEQFDVLIHLDAEDIGYVYEWRLHQEHALVAERGVGMSDERVREFVDGYMPSYELYVPALRKGIFKEKGKQMRAVIGRGWKVVKTEEL